MKHVTRKRIVMLAIAVLLMCFKMVSCGGLDLGCDTSDIGCDSSGCDSMGCDGCGDGGFAMLPWGAYPVDEKIMNLAQLRVTQAGFSYIERNAQSIIAAALGAEGGLCFPVDETSIGLCNMCSGGCELCLDIANILINPIEGQDTLEVKIYLSSDTVIFLPFSGFLCDLTCQGVNIDFRQQPMEITTYIQLHIDGDTRLLDLSVTDPTFNWDQINIELAGLCGFGTNFVLDLLVPAVEPILKPMIRNMIEDLIEAFKCVRCQENPCPDPLNYGVTCDDNKVCRKPNGYCLLQPLGIEAEVDVGALAAEFLPSLESKIWLSLAAGGRAEVLQQGLEIAMFGGTMVPPDAPDPCTETVYYATDPLPRIEVGNENLHQNPPTLYHVGAGLREELLDQAGYTLQNSGLLCITLSDAMLFELSPDIGGFLSWNALKLLMPTTNLLTHDENVPLVIRLEPGDPIDFAILDGETAFPTTPGVNIALEARIRDLKLHFYALVDERFMRMFTMQVDIVATFGIDNQDSAIQPVFGLDNVRLAPDPENPADTHPHFRVPYSVLGVPPAEVGTQLEGMIASVIGQIPLDPFDAIEIPGFDINGDDVEDLFLNIEDIAPEMPKGDVEEYYALYAYVSLVMNSRGLPPSPPTLANTEVFVEESFNPTTEQFVKEGMKPWIRLALSGKDADHGSEFLEWSFKLDNKGWSPWSRDPNPTLSPNWFMWPGKHRIGVRARDYRFRSSIDPQPEYITFVTDYVDPSLRLKREGSRIRFMGKDNVARSDELRYRHRLNGGKWSAWSANDSFDLALLREFPVKMTVEVKDTVGLTASQTRTYNGAFVNPVQAKITGSGGGTPEEAKAPTGCANGGGALGWLFLLVLLPLAAIRRKTALRPLVLLSVLALSMLLFSACGSSSSGSCTTNTDCGAGQMCSNGKCVDAPDGDYEVDFQPPDGDEFTDGDEEAVDGDDETDEEAGLSCDKHEDCPDCYYCSSNVCTLQRCDPDCSQIDSCAVQKNDSCSQCKMDTPIYECKTPRCTVANQEEDCACRECPTDDPSISPVPICRESLGECYCPPVCGGGCPTEGDNLGFCCTVFDPVGSCMRCPYWCEGVQCEPGFGPGSCDEGAEECQYNAILWQRCDNYNDTTCEFSGIGLSGDPSCECIEKPPLPIGHHGRFNDIAVHTNNEDIWFTAYNETYGDLMVGYTKYSQIVLRYLDWKFIDGVPDDDPVAGPSGPRGGVKGSGDDVGKFTSLGLNQDGWPRIAYQDVDNGDLLFIYTNGDPAGTVDGDVDGDADTAADGDAEAAEGSRGRGPGDDFVELADYQWTRIVVDETGDTGYYVDMWLDDSDRPVIAYTMISDDEGTVSQLKLAMATTPNPTGPEDFVITVVDSAPLGDPCAETEDCFKRDGLPEGTGLHATLAPYPNGELWLFYYRNSAFAEGAYVKEQRLMKAVLNGGAPDPATLATATFTITDFLAAFGDLAEDDAGLFNSFFVIPSTGWYVLAFYNATLNQLQFVYDTGDGMHLRTADDGWRRNQQGSYYQVMVGADANVVMDPNGYTRILYQNQDEAKLMYYSENCFNGTCSDKVMTPMLEMTLGADSNGNAVDWGHAYGFYPTQALVGMQSVVGTYTVDTKYESALEPTEPVLELQILTAPPEIRR